MLRWLRTLGKAGELAAAAITLIDAKITWAIVVSFALALLTLVWTALFDFFNSQHTQIAIGVFLAALWTHIGLRVLRSFRQPIRTLPAADFRYCLSPEGFAVAFDPTNPDLAFALVFNLRNVGTWPIKILVEEFDVRIQDRATPRDQNKIEIVVPRVGGRAIRSGGFKREILKDRATGTLRAVIHYGDPDGSFVRKYSFTANLNFLFFKNTEGEYVAGSVSEDAATEKDERL